MFLIMISLLIVIGTQVEAKTCSTPYDKSSLPYPSRQQLCPNGGIFTDYLTGKSHPCEMAQVDHVIPTKLMYDLGVCGDRLKAFSADTDNLRLTFSRLNLEKSNKNPLLYAVRHGEQAENAVEAVVNNMARKFPELSPAKLKEEADVLKNAEIKMLYRQKNRALDQARIQQAARKKIKQKISARMIAALGRNSALTSVESSTLILAPIALAAIAWDIRDTCNTIADLNELESQENSFENLGEADLDYSNENSLAVCGLSEDELLKFLKIDPERDKCVAARIYKNEINPSECEGFDLTIPTYQKSDHVKETTIKVPSYE